MSQNCGYCNLNLYQEAFLRDMDTGQAVYFASPKFNLEIKEEVIFCSAKCSTNWHKTYILNSKQPNNTINQGTN